MRQKDFSQRYNSHKFVPVLSSIKDKQGGETSPVVCEDEYSPKPLRFCHSSSKQFSLLDLLLPKTATS